MKALTTGPFTGRHFAAIMVAFFAVVIAVNLLMARDAISTFSGVVVENSYVASQQYNGWLHQAADEKALGWSAAVTRLPDGHLAVRLDGAPDAALLTAELRHPLGRMPDQDLTFVRQDDGRFVSQQQINGGRWKLRLLAVAGTRRWHTEQDLP